MHSATVSGLWPGLVRLLATAVILAVVAAAGEAVAATPSGVTQFSVPTSSITDGPDGNLWFTTGGSVGRITTPGVATLFAVPGAGSYAGDIASGPDGNVWFTESGFVGRITPGGTITQFPTSTSNVVCAPGYVPKIASTPDGKIWLTSSVGDRIGWLNASTGVISWFDLTMVGGSCVTSITRGPDGQLWFVDSGFNDVGWISSTGAVTAFALPTYPSGAGELTSGPDGNLWFTESANKIGRVTPTGTITEFPLPTGFGPAAIATGSDGNLWFTQWFGGSVPIGYSTRVGRITRTGAVAESAGPAGVAITSGSDGNLWIAEGSRVARMPAVLLPLSLSPPTISGNALQGQTLSILHATWTNSPTTYLYEWDRCTPSGGVILVRNCTAIPGAAGATYTVAAADVGDALLARETAITAAGGMSSPALSTPTALVQAARPVNVTPPSISGRTVEGATVAERHGTWTNVPATYAYQWQDCDAHGGRCTPIKGATSQTMKLTARDLGHTVRVLETAGNVAGRSAPAVSLPTGVVQSSAPVLTGLRLSPRAFKAAARGASALEPGGSPTGTHLRFSLSAAATVTFTVARAAPGRRSNGACRAPSRNNRKKPRCTRHVAVHGHFTVVGFKGLNGLRFTGRLNGRKLAVGNYLLTASPAANGVRGTARSAPFAIR